MSSKANLKAVKKGSDNGNLSGPQPANKQISGGQAKNQAALSNGRPSDESNERNRLVFGLGSRTNRLKHDEYAESRRSGLIENIQQQRQQIGPKKPTSEIKVNDRSTSSSIPTTKQDKPSKIKAMSENVQTPQQTNKTNQESRSSKKSISLSKPSDKSQNKVTSSNSATPTPNINAITTKTSENKLNSTIASNEPNKNLSTSQKQSKELTLANEKENLLEVSNKVTPRMQFNIPPPPKQNQIHHSALSGSVVSYAKSRIYNKPVKQILSNPPQESFTVLTDLTGEIPQSILSGFKPPKRVNVNKARERWEGGEPFARCKSRLRLAAQANKKLLHETWSMTSVVATQQLQFQQALANSQTNSTQKNLLNALNDSSIKALSRGNVLERVQQFEKSPHSTGSSSINSPASSDDDVDYDDDINNSDRSYGSYLKQFQNNDPANCINLNSSFHYQQQIDINNKQSQYKDKLLSIKNSNDLISNNPKLSNNVKTRRLSFQRRSSSTASNSNQIPKFYHPNGKPNTYDIEVQKRNIVSCFDKLPDRKAQLNSHLRKRHFKLISLACGFSEYFKEPLCAYIRYQLKNSNLLFQSNPGRKQSQGSIAINTDTINDNNTIRASSLMKATSIDNSTIDQLKNQDYITCEQFLNCWKQLINCCFDNETKFIHLLTFGKRKFLLADDFVPLIQSIIDDHPGLKFLREAPDFHMRYIQTVISRIYYCINKSWTHKITINELRNSNFLAVLKVLSHEDDINQITDYFSYEHFYVIYCKFWNLDQDHDLLISKEDLSKHQDSSISPLIIERIFSGIVSKQIVKIGKMSYPEFVWFLIAEEDKKHPRSIEYWFRLMDLDGDGFISMYEMEYFYFEQMKRLKAMNIEALPFLDCACQILDLVNPREKNKISLSDLKRTKMASIFFDTFINLEKYLEHESREFISSRDAIQGGVVISDWDRYASDEYESLIAEESSI